MGIYKNNQKFSGVFEKAKNIVFDKLKKGLLKSDNVQDAIDENSLAISELNSSLNNKIECGIYLFTSNGSIQTLTIPFKNAHSSAPDVVCTSLQRESSNNILTGNVEVYFYSGKDFSVHVNGINGLNYKIHWIAKWL